MPEQFWQDLDYVLYNKDLIQLAIYALVFLYCLARRAPAPETILSGTLVGMGVVDKLHHLAVGGSILWRETDLGHLAIDSLAMACMFVVALHANRIYPLWIAGAQIIAMSGHFYRMALEEIDNFAYDVMAITPSYIQFVAMIIGLGFHMSRRRRLGSYPSWRHSFALAPARVAKTLPAG